MDAIMQRLDALESKVRESLAELVPGRTDPGTFDRLTGSCGLPGLFAGGDVSDACPKQIATAVGTGVHAAISVQEYLSRLT